MSIMWDWAYGKRTDTRQGHVYNKAVQIAGTASGMGVNPTSEFLLLRGRDGSGRNSR